MHGRHLESYSVHNGVQIVHYFNYFSIYFLTPHIRIILYLIFIYYISMCQIVLFLHSAFYRYRLILLSMSLVDENLLMNIPLCIVFYSMHGKHLVTRCAFLYRIIASYGTGFGNALRGRGSCCAWVTSAGLFTANMVRWQVGMEENCPVFHNMGL